MQTSNTTPVWLVDDDEDDQLLIRSAFEQHCPAVDILVLNDGQELLATLAETVDLPRLILLDINMPRKNGFETLRELRQIPDFAHLPIVMLTTSSNEDDRNRCLALGAKKFLTKPLTYDKLTPLVKSLINEWDLVC